jgi:hypothetical protein
MTLCKAAPIPTASVSKAWVCGRSLAGIVGSNPAGGMDGCLLWVLCVKSLRRDDNSSRAVLPRVVYLSVIVKPSKRGGPGPLGMCHKKKSKEDCMNQYGEECNGQVRICQDLWYKISPHFYLPFTNHMKKYIYRWTLLRFSCGWTFHLPYNFYQNVIKWFTIND